MFVKPSYECSDEMLLEGPDEPADAAFEEMRGPRAVLAKELCRRMHLIHRLGNFALADMQKPLY